jgi:hypothetical protein
MKSHDTGINWNINYYLDNRNSALLTYTERFYTSYYRNNPKQRLRQRELFNKRSNILNISNKKPPDPESRRGYKERTYDALLNCQLPCH